MSRFKRSYDLKENGENFSVYMDKKTGKYYKINRDLVEEVSKRDVEIIESARRVINARKSNRVLKYALIYTSLLVGTSAVLAVVMDNPKMKNFLTKNKTDKKIEVTVSDEDYVLLENMGRKSYLHQIVSENKTLNDKLIDEYIAVLSTVPMSDTYFITFSLKLKNYNFSNSRITIDELDELFDLNDYGFVANELYDYVHKTGSYKKYQVTANLFVNDDDVLRRLFALEDLEDLIYEKVGSKVSIDDIADNIKVSEKILKIRGKYHCLWELKNNIFNKFVHFDMGVFKDNGDTYEDITDVYYRGEFIKKIYKDSEFDYTNKEDRILLYFYVTAQINSFNLVDFHPKEPADAIFDGLPYQSTVRLDKGDLYDYLSNKGFHYYKLDSFSTLANYINEGSLGLLVELNLCFKEDMKDGYLYDEQYSRFLEQIEEICDPVDYQRFIKECNKNKPVDGFKLDLKKGCNL